MSKEGSSRRKIQGVKEPGGDLENVPFVLARQTERRRRQDFAANGPPNGTIIDRRFRVESAMSGRENPDTVLLHATDLADMLPVVVKFYLKPLDVRGSAANRLLNKTIPNVVPVKGVGMWNDHLYEALAWCEGGSVLEHSPFHEAEVRAILPGINEALRELHGLGIIHRGIKPGNLLYRQENRRGLSVSDHGSALTLDEIGSAKVPPDLKYAAPEVLRNLAYTLKSDYYSLGVTLVHLLSGSSPFEQDNDRAIVARHLEGRVIIPDQINPETRDLLQGLLTPDPEKRWGYREVRLWLRGKSPAGDAAKSAVGPSAEGYPGYPRARTPRELAANLGRFRVEDDLLRGRLTAWVDRFDPYLANRIEDLAAHFSGDPGLGLFTLRHLLDPTLPLLIGATAAPALTDVIRLVLRASDAPEKEAALARELVTVQQDGRLASWIEATLDSPESARLVSRLRRVRHEVRGASLVLMALRSTLAPGAPFTFADETVKSPAELAELVLRKPAKRLELEKGLAEGPIEEWIRGTCWEDTGLVQFMGEWRRRFDLRRGTEERERFLRLWGWAFCWKLNPGAPMPFGDRFLRVAWELPITADENESNRLLAVKLLREDWIGSWLRLTRQIKDEAALDALWNEPSWTWDERLEEVLHLIDPTLKRPIAAFDPSSLDLGTISAEKTHTYPVVLYGAGRGHLSGKLKVRGTKGGLEVSPRSVEGPRTVILLQVNAGKLPSNTVFEGTVEAECCGTTYRLPVRCIPQRPLTAMVWRSLKAGLTLGLSAGVARWLLDVYVPEFAELSGHPLSLADMDRMSGAVVLALVLTLILTAIGTMWLRNIWRDRKKDGDEDPKD